GGGVEREGSSSTRRHGYGWVRLRGRRGADRRRAASGWPPGHPSRLPGGAAEPAHAPAPPPRRGPDLRRGGRPGPLRRGAAHARRPDAEGDRGRAGPRLLRSRPLHPVLRALDGPHAARVPPPLRPTRRGRETSSPERAMVAGTRWYQRVTPIAGSASPSSLSVTIWKRFGSLHWLEVEGRSAVLGDQDGRQAERVHQRRLVGDVRPSAREVDDHQLRLLD